MKAYEIENIINDFAPKELAYQWDNVGILIGNTKKEIKKVLLTLDTNEYTVNEAIENRCDMIISHHPILLNGIKRITCSTSDGRMIENLIKNDIVVLAAHTNMDTAEHGINYELANLFGLQNVKIIDKNGENTGLGRYGQLKSKINLGDLAKLVKEKLHTPHVRVCGNTEKAISTVAVASGSCSELIPTALDFGCDVIITADMKYHISMDSVASGIAVIDAGHYPTEILVMDIFKKILTDTDIEMIKSKNKDIFSYI